LERVPTRKKGGGIGSFAPGRGFLPRGKTEEKSDSIPKVKVKEGFFGKSAAEEGKKEK